MAAPELPPDPTPPKHAADMLDYLLLTGTILFAISTAVISKWSPSDGQTFQFFCGLTTNFSGAFLGRLIPSLRKQQ